MNRAFVAAALALTVAACGNRTELRPQAGERLPPPPLGREERLTAEELLARPPQAAPERSVELRRRSEERQDDPFDLPPIDPTYRAIAPGEAAPAVCEERTARRDATDQLACLPPDPQAPARPG